MSEDELRKKIARQMEEDFRSDVARAFDKYGLTASLHRSFRICFAAICLASIGLFIWSVFHH